MKLNVEFIARRQRELGLSRRAVASAVNVSLTRVTNLYDGKHKGTFTLDQVGRLADALACRAGDLLLHDNATPAASPCADELLMQAIGALLQSANGPVSAATLAKATGTDLLVIEAALSQLAIELERVGLAIRRNTNDGALSIVATANVSDEQLQVVLRGEQARQELSTNVAALLYRCMTEHVTPRSVESSNDRRVQFGRLVNAGYVQAGARKNQAVELSDDVRESLLLDVR